MEYFEVIEKRFSCRSFKDKKIKKEEIQKIVEAGRLAPTACNYQPEKIYVIEDPILLEKLKEGTRYTFNAKTVFIVAHDKRISWHRGNDGVDHGKVDSTIVATQMVLAATALGIGSCYVCSMKEAVLRDILDISDDFEIDIILPMGYPLEMKKHNSRKNVEDIVVYK